MRASLWLCLWAAGCAGEVELPGSDPTDGTVPVDPVAGLGTPFTWDLPDYFPPPRVPDDNPMTVEKVALGRHLFYDPRLSGNETQSCATCHEQARGFTDGRVLPEGSTGEPGLRNAMALGNVAYHSTLTWANPVLLDFEQQILVPIFGEFPVELGVAGQDDEVLARFVDDPMYAELYDAAFPKVAPADRISWDTTIDALASFVRSIVSFRTPYDDLTYRGVTDALTGSERRGMEMFFSEKFECHHCHGGPLFSNSFETSKTALPERPFFNTGLYNIGGDGSYPPDNPGLWLFTGEPEDMGAFRPPSLRNVAVTAPYMHDGSVATLEEALDHYARGGRLIEDGPYAGDGRRNPYKSPFVPGFDLSEQERTDLVAFLTNALLDEAMLTDPALSDPFAE